MEGIKNIATNKKARFEYNIEETFEAGIVLCGTEVKSLRKGQMNFKDSYAAIKNQEVFLLGMHISSYEMGNIYNVDETRERKLLLHKSEIRKLIGKIQQKGFSLIPTRMYFKGSKVKVEIGLAKGKKLYDKRQDQAKKDSNRQIDLKVKEFNR